jgi:hypothetical protein
MMSVREQVLHSLTCILLPGIILNFAGCSKKGPSQERGPAEQRLYLIGKAYGQACHDLGRPPQGFEEIEPYLEANAPPDVVRSPNDGEPFVIFWNQQYSRAPVGNDPSIVIAYEKRGVDGSRCVLRFPLQILRMTDEEFAKASFPPGYQPSH